MNKTDKTGYAHTVAPVKRKNITKFFIQFLQKLKCGLSLEKELIAVC